MMTRLAAGMIRRPADRKSPEPKSSSRFVVSQQDAGDHKAGDDEEDVDAYITATDSGYISVKEDD